MLDVADAFTVRANTSIRKDFLAFSRGNGSMDTGYYRCRLSHAVTIGQIRCVQSFPGL